MTIHRAMSPRPATLATAAAVVALLFTLPCAAQSHVQGRVVNAAGRPVPGLTVSVANPQVGRSTPSVTDAGGRYSIERIPDARSPFYLEVYWGSRVVFRDTLALQHNASIERNVSLAQ